jgi:Terpene synthase family 2, C-terminal metal binding
MLIYLFRHAFASNRKDCPVPLPLPPLHCPYAVAMHPDTEAADIEALSWADRFGIAAEPPVRRRIARTRTARLAGRICPRATWDGLVCITELQTWLFLFDDAYCDESEIGCSTSRTAELGVAVLRVLEHGRPVTGAYAPFLSSFADLRERLRELATPAQFEHFVGKVIGYLFALAWEAAHRERRSPAGLTEYQDLRRHSSAVPPFLALIEAVNGFQLSESVRAEPRLRELELMVIDITCWGNDILSYPKEYLRSTDVLSLPAVLSHERGLDAENALKEAALLHDDRVREYGAAEALLRGHPDASLDRYLDDLRCWISGNLAWSYETGRYGLNPV